MRFEPGDTVGAYRVTGILGEGAIGVVYQVVNQVTGRLEALKVLNDGFSRDLDRVQRFLREIQLQAKLEHPNIAQVRTAFTEGETLVLVLELIEGEPLSQVLQRGPLPPGAALSIAMQLLDALSLAHAKEVIHRDIKPANVLITRNGVAKLTDFGLAKQRTEPSGTSPGIAVGTVFYMPPEQVRGLGDIDWRADLYAVGVVLYEMLTGRKPFDGPEHFTVMRAHMEFEPPPPSSLVPYLPPSVDAVVSRALQKDAANRFQSAAEFLIALRQLTSAPSAPPQPAAVPARSTSWRLSLPLSAAAVILLLAAFAMPRFDWREESLVLPLPSPPAGPSDPVLAAVPRQASEASEPLPPASIKPKDRPRPLSPPSARPSPSQANAATKPFHASRILNAEKPELETPKLVEVTGAHPSVPQAPLVATPPPAVQSTPAPGVPSKPVIEPALPADRPAGWVRRTFGRWFRKEAPKQTPDKP